MSRTPEQKSADDALTAAIEQTLKAYGEDKAYVLTEYLVITSQQRFDEDGDSITAVGVVLRDSDVAHASRARAMRPRRDPTPTLDHPGASQPTDVPHTE